MCLVVALHRKKHAFSGLVGSLNPKDCRHLFYIIIQVQVVHYLPFDKHVNIQTISLSATLIIDEKNGSENMCLYYEQAVNTRLECVRFNFYDKTTTYDGIFFNVALRSEYIHRERLFAWYEL